MTRPDTCGAAGGAISLWLKTDGVLITPSADKLEQVKQGPDSRSFVHKIRRLGNHFFNRPRAEYEGRLCFYVCLSTGRGRP